MRRRSTIAVLLALGLLLAAFGPASADAGASAAKRKTTAAAKKQRAHHRAAKHKAQKRRAKRRAARRRNAGIGLKPAVAVDSAPQAGDPDLLFRASRIDEFYLQQSAPGAVTEVADPAGSGESVLKMTVADGDVAPITPTENPRAELISDPVFKPGMEFWASAKFFLPADFPASVPDWLTVLEGPYGAPWSGTPPWHIEVSGDSIRWSRNGTYNWDVPWEMPLVRDRWVNVLLHERFGADGWIEMWIDGQPITFFGSDTYNPAGVAPTTRLAMQTQDASNSQCPCSLYEMNYRKVGMFSSVSTLQGPLAIGTTRASVES